MWAFDLLPLCIEGFRSIILLGLPQGMGGLEVMSLNEKNVVYNHKKTRNHHLPIWAKCSAIAQQNLLMDFKGNSKNLNFLNWKFSKFLASKNQLQISPKSSKKKREPENVKNAKCKFHLSKLSTFKKTKSKSALRPAHLCAGSSLATISNKKRISNQHNLISWKIVNKKIILENNK